MARKELIWKRNTKEDSSIVQSTLSRLSSSSNDKQDINLDLISTVEPTVQDTVESTAESIVQATVLNTVEPSTQKSVETTSLQANQEDLEVLANTEHKDNLPTIPLSNHQDKISNSIPSPLIVESEKEQEYLSILSKLDQSILSELANTHKETEHHIYLVMYCESRKHNSKDRYFSGIEIARLIGLKHRRNIMDVLQRLEMKKCISVITSKPGEVLGKEYRVYEPEEILERRKKSKMRIHPQTKKIV